MNTDPIADLLTRIKNGYMARQDSIIAPYSKFKEALLDIFTKLGYINGFTKDNKLPRFNINLKYIDNKPKMTDVQRLSKPGLRRFAEVKDLVKIKSGWGYMIISTSKGLKTHIQAKKERLGGEVICKIW
jgi:small subunit ribosomal protein S8